MFRAFRVETAMYMRWFILIFLLTGPALGQTDSHVERVEAFHKQRLAKLTSADGYLTLVGLYWVGEKPIEVPGFGKARLKDNKVLFDIPTSAGDLVTTELFLNLPEGQQRLRSGTRSLYAIKRGNSVGLRMKDSESEARQDFQGVSRFPVVQNWRIPGRLIPETEEVDVESVVGVTTSEKSPGWAEFDYGGKAYRVRLIGEPEDKKFFLVFSDETAGKSTYPACRFLYVERGTGDELVLDFNNSINPACAFTSFATCPLPPKENILDFPVEAGEKKP